MLWRFNNTRSLIASFRARPSTNNATHSTRLRSTTAKPKPSPPASPAPERPSDYSSRPIRRGIAWAASLFLTVHIFISYVLDYGLCDGISMLPTFNSFGDAVLISKYYRRGREVKVGDVISYVHPIYPETRGLKRIVGIEGDFVLRDTPGAELEEGEEKMLQVCANSRLAVVLMLRLRLLLLIHGFCRCPKVTAGSLETTWNIRAIRGCLDLFQWL